MRTLEERLSKYEKDNAQIQGIDFSVIIYNDVVRALREAMVDTIKECAEQVTDSSISENKLKILSLITQIK
jgi:hypothetical protein